MAKAGRHLRMSHEPAMNQVMKLLNNYLIGEHSKENDGIDDRAEFASESSQQITHAPIDK